jgi:hypothetical protein
MLRSRDSLFFDLPLNIYETAMKRKGKDVWIAKNSVFQAQLKKGMTIFLKQ